MLSREQFQSSVGFPEGDADSYKIRPQTGSLPPPFAPPSPEGTPKLIHGDRDGYPAGHDECHDGHAAHRAGLPASPFDHAECRASVDVPLCNFRCGDLSAQDAGPVGYLSACA